LVFQGDILREKSAWLQLKKVKNDIDKIDDIETLREICLKCVETGENIVKELLKKSLPKDKEKLENYLLNLQKVKPEIFKVNDAEELRKIARAGIGMIKNILYGVKKR
jgi:hypothetical protein